MKKEKINLYKSILKKINKMWINWFIINLFSLVGLVISLLGVTEFGSKIDIRNMMLIIGISTISASLILSFLINYLNVKKIKKIIKDIDDENKEELMLHAKFCIISPISKGLLLKTKIKYFIKQAEQKID